MEAAILREKTIKEWKRSWKIRRIEDRKPEWKDIYGQLL
jgi:putative endonuclease